MKIENVSLVTKAPNLDVVSQPVRLRQLQIVKQYTKNKHLIFRIQLSNFYPKMIRGYAPGTLKKTKAN
jgi:hypothetical protein